MSRTKLRLASPPAALPGAVTGRHKVRFLESFEQHLSMMLACEDADIDPGVLRKVLREDEEFRTTVQAIRTRQGEKVRTKALQMALSGNEAMIRLVLPALLPDEFGDRRTVNVNISSPEDLRSKTREELLALRDQCRK